MDLDTECFEGFGPWCKPHGYEPPKVSFALLKSWLKNLKLKIKIFFLHNKNLRSKNWDIIGLITGKSRRIETFKKAYYEGF